MTVKRPGSPWPTWASLNLSTLKAQGQADSGGVRRVGMGWAEVSWAASKGRRVVALTADWLNKIGTTRYTHVLVTAVVETGPLCCP